MVLQQKVRRLGNKRDAVRRPLRADSEGGPISIAVPDDPITKVQFKDRRGVERRCSLGSTEDAGSAEALKAKQLAISEALSAQVGFRGAFLKGKLIDHVLGLGDTAGESCKPMVAVPGQAVPAMLSPQKASGGGGRASRRRASQPAANAAPASSSQPAAPAAPAVASGAVAAASLGQKKAGRGRPKKDLKIEADKYLTQSATSLPTDSAWWGAEAKTQVKVIQNLQKEIPVRLKMTGDLHEIDVLNKADKQLTSMANLVEEARAHGLNSPEFNKMYDTTQTMLNLAPVVSLDVPPHTHTLAVGAIQNGHHVGGQPRNVASVGQVRGDEEARCAGHRCGAREVVVGAHGQHFQDQGLP